MTAASLFPLKVTKLCNNYVQFCRLIFVSAHVKPVSVSGPEEGDVTVVASQVQGYGVWDGALAQGGTLLNGCKGPAPSLLFLWVTDAQANLLQMELTAIQASTTSSGDSCV